MLAPWPVFPLFSAVRPFWLLGWQMVALVCLADVDDCGS